MRRSRRTSKKEAALEIGNLNDVEELQAILKAIVGNGYQHDEIGRRLLLLHAAAIVETIQEKAEGDLKNPTKSYFEQRRRRHLPAAHFDCSVRAR